MVQSINLDLVILDVIPVILFIVGVAIVCSCEHDFLTFRNSDCFLSYMYGLCLVKTISTHFAKPAPNRDGLTD